MSSLTEDEVRDLAKNTLHFASEKDVKVGVGQLTSFNQLGFKGVQDKPDGWYLPKNINDVAIIHKDGKTNLEQLDSRKAPACEWIKDKPITKVLMNPPFENKYGCIDIVKNVLDNVQEGTICAFILPDKKLEKVGNKGRNLLKKHSLKKIIKLSEKTFFEGVTTSVFVFEAGKPQNDEEIFACYIEEDGLETVKNQGRQDIKDKWKTIEDYWIDIIKKQSGNDTIQWLKPSENLSYQMPKAEFKIYEEDFTKTVMDYLMFEQGIDIKELKDRLIDKVLYSSDIQAKNDTIFISLKTKGD